MVGGCRRSPSPSANACSRALQARAQREDVSVVDLLRAVLVELTDDGITPEFREMIERSINANKLLLDRLAEGPRTYHNVDAG